MPYTGVGSGITRALDEDINVTFMNNNKAQEFVITVWREESNEVEKKSNQVEGKSNQVEQKSNEVEEESNEVEEKSNQVQDSDIRLRHSNTNLDTQLRHSNTNLDTQLRHSDTDLATDHDTFVEDHDTIHSYHDTNHDTKRVPLTNKQKDIVNFCSVPRTSREILERAGVVYHTKNIAKYITSLVAAGFYQLLLMKICILKRFSHSMLLPYSESSIEKFV